MLVSVVVPAYREKKIKEAIRAIHDVMHQTRWNFEIIVVVDGLVDDTYERAKEVTLKDLTVYCLKENHGKGFATRYGATKANGDYIVFMDAGMEINPNGISMLLEHMEWYDADIIVGSKRHPASKTNLSRIRKIYSWGYYLGTKFLFGLKVRDTQAGIKVFKRGVLDNVLPRLTIKEFAMDIELLVVAQHLGHRRIFEAPIEIYLDIGSTSKIQKNILIFTNPYIRQMLWDTIKIFYRLHFLGFYDDGKEYNWLPHAVTAHEIQYHNSS